MHMAEKTTEITPHERQAIGPRAPLWSPSPFRMLERFADEMDRVFDDFGFGRSWPGPRPGRSWLRTPWRTQTEMWSPEIEVSHQNNELLVRADLPGMKKDDVCVDVTDDAITISGERQQDEKTERGGIYRSERSYGSFCRTIPLPEGANADQAKATFKNGVLEIRMPAPEQATRGRRLEIKEAAETKK
jgi:HSP20 family protein